MQKKRYFYCLHKIQADKNQRRFYTLRVSMNLFREWAVIREWGRIGSKGRVQFNTFLSEDDAHQCLQGLLKSKLKKGYILQ